MKKDEGQEEARCPQSCADGRRDGSRERQGSPLPVLPTWLKPTEHSSCSLAPQYHPCKWVPVGLLHLQGTQVRLEKQFWIHLGARVYRWPSVSYQMNSERLGESVTGEVTVPREGHEMGTGWLF